MKKRFIGLFLFFLILTKAFTSDSVEKIIREMPLREKIGQLFIIRPESIDEKILENNARNKSDYGIEALSLENIEFYNHYPAGGFILFARNINNPEQVKKFTEQLHRLGNIKPLICIDEEGGRVARLANKADFNLPKFENAKAIGKSGSPELAFDMGQIIGKYLFEYGFDVDFAPIADIDTNPDNPVIGDRAFGSKPEIVSEFAFEMLKGLESENIAGCYKHFPGHGDTNTDTHLSQTFLYKNWEELLSCELIPFMDGIKKNIPMIMTAHIVLPEITGDSSPASLSNTVITGIIREEFNYDGLLITDSLTMKAITNQYSNEESAVQTILAGNDFILLPPDYKEAYEAVLNAVKCGIIDEKRIDESLRRILNFKEKRINFSKFCDLALD